LDELLHKLQESFTLPLSYFFSPEKRIFVGYLITSTILAYFIYKKTKRTKSFKAYIFNKKVWLSQSAKTDYAILILNAFIKIFIILPILFFGTDIAESIYFILKEILGLPSFTINPTTLIILFTITLTILNDFTNYLLHYLMHKVPFLWEFHKTHHSATVLNPITQYRIHPVELLINNVKNVLVISIVTGTFFYLAAYQVEKMTILGVNMFSFLFLSFGANLRHSHVKLTYFDWLENILISPFQHQIHHSNNSEHYNKNFGSKLAIWDNLFGTLLRSKQVNKVQFGLAKDKSELKSLKSNILEPFNKLFKLLMNFSKN